MTSRNSGVISPVVVELLRCLGYAIGLRPFWTLDNLKLNRIPLVECFVSLAYDCGVMDKYIGTVIPSDETVALGVVEPLDLTSHSSSSPGTNSLVSGAT